MKKLFILCFLFLGMGIYAQSDSDKRYGYLEVKNASGHNFIDFKLTYDGYSNCYNNIQLFTEDQDVNIYFQIYLDGKMVYDGWAKMAANTNYYLDDAFYDCHSSFKEILIKTQPRYQ